MWLRGKTPIMIMIEEWSICTLNSCLPSFYSFPRNLSFQALLWFIYKKIRKSTMDQEIKNLSLLHGKIALLQDISLCPFKAIKDGYQSVATIKDADTNKNMKDGVFASSSKNISCNEYNNQSLFLAVLTMETLKKISCLIICSYNIL